MDALLVLFAGVLVAILLRGLARAIARYTGMTPGWGLVVVLLALVVLVGLVWWLLAPEIGRQVHELTRTLPEAWQRLQGQLDDSRTGRRLLSQLERADEWLSERQALNRATSLLSTTVGAVAGLVIVLAIGAYLASEPRAYTDGVVRLLPPRRRQEGRAVLTAVGETLEGWLAGRFIGMAVIGVLTWAGLALLGVPLALTLALIAALLTFIPNIGPVLSVIPAALLALVQSASLAGWVLLLYLVIQTVESYLLTPLVQRKMIRMPPGLTFGAQLVMGSLLGVAGVALAVPLTAAATTLVRELYVAPMERDG
jgi:predicted PurR-regulated permease PerM